MKNQARPKLTSFCSSMVAIVLTVALFVCPLFAQPASISFAQPASSITNPASIGISYGDTLVWDSTEELSKTLNDAVALGVTTIRVDLGWDDIQPYSASIYKWTNFDRVVNAARARNLTLLPTLAYTPIWARPSGCTTPKCVPADPNAFASFAAAAATRYAPMGIHTWEIWNEPNIVNFWQPTPNATQYIQLLSATSKAIKVVDPKAFIVSAGLAPSATSDGNIAPLDFFRTFADQGGLSLVDAVGFHPYSYPVPPTYNADWNAWQQMARTSMSVESILVAYGATNKKIWITEYGAPTNGPGVEATPSNYNLTHSPDHVSEALQAQLVNDSVRLARSSSYIGALYWYSYKDLGTDKSDIENFFGLRRFNGSAKPAWQGLRSAIVATNSRLLHYLPVILSSTQNNALCLRDRKKV